MDKILDRILKFFENKSIHFGLRTSIFIISIFILTISDYYFNFSYDYHLNNKIEKLKSINSLKNTYKTDSLKLVQLTELENRIFKRTHYSDRLRNLDISQFKVLNKTDTTKIKGTVIKNDTVINKPIRSVFWMVLTSSYFFIILIIILLSLPFKGYPHSTLKNVLGSIAVIIILIGVVSFLTWVAYKIPMIYNRPYLNYILNAILQSPLIYLIFWWNKKVKN